MDYFIKVRSERSYYLINPSQIETVRCLHNGEVKLEFISGRIDSYRGDEAKQIINAMEDLEIPVNFLEKPPSLNELID